MKGMNFFPSSLNVLLLISTEELNGSKAVVYLHSFANTYLSTIMESMKIL